MSTVAAPRTAPILRVGTAGLPAFSGILGQCTNMLRRCTFVSEFHIYEVDGEQPTPNHESRNDLGERISQIADGFTEANALKHVILDFPRRTAIGTRPGTAQLQRLALARCFMATLVPRANANRSKQRVLERVTLNIDRKERKT